MASQKGLPNKLGVIISKIKLDIILRNYLQCTWREFLISNGQIFFKVDTSYFTKKARDNIKY